MIPGTVWTVISHLNEGNRIQSENRSDAEVCVIPSGSEC